MSFEERLVAVGNGDDAGDVGRVRPGGGSERDARLFSLPPRFCGDVPLCLDQKALLVNSSVGLGFGNTVSEPGLAIVDSVRNALPCESRPW